MRTVKSHYPPYSSHKLMLKHWVLFESLSTNGVSYCPIVVVVMMQCVAGRLERFQFVAAMRLRGRQLVFL